MRVKERESGCEGERGGESERVAGGVEGEARRGGGGGGVGEDARMKERGEESFERERRGEGEGRGKRERGVKDGQERGERGERGERDWCRVSERGKGRWGGGR